MLRGYKRVRDGGLSVPWIPSPRLVLEYLMDLLNVAPSDTFVDLGCGDGRVVVEAAKRGARAICIEIDRILCNITEIRARLEGVEDRIDVICKSFFEVDIRALKPTIVYAYLYPSTLQELSNALENLDKGTIIATLDFAIRGWSPIFAKALIDEDGYDRALWVYVVGLSNPKARRVGVSRDLRAFASRLGRRKLTV